MFRIANARRNEIVGIEATVILARFVTTNGLRTRTFTDLALERRRVIFFSLSWTVVHPIDESSPMWGLSAQEMVDSEAEFLILLSGTDETFFQTVSARGSYTAAELLWGHKFTNIFLPPAPDGIVRIDLALIDGTEEALLPAPVPAQ
jgi:inward rectifier potassium channel